MATPLLEGHGSQIGLPQDQSRVSLPFIMLGLLLLLEKYFSINSKKMTDQEGLIFPEKKKETAISGKVKNIPKIGVEVSHPLTPVTCRPSEAFEAWTRGL